MLRGTFGHCTRRSRAFSPFLLLVVLSLAILRAAMGFAFPHADLGKTA
jgi:hypothetical protein